MTETKVIQLIREHLEGQFPKKCANCHRQFATLRDYLMVVQPLGQAISYDAEAGDWNPTEPLGTLTFANCPCGSTMALSSTGMPLFRLWSLMNWARMETMRRHMTPRELLNYLRGEIRHQVLREPSQEPPKNQG